MSGPSRLVAPRPCRVLSRHIPGPPSIRTICDVELSPVLTAMGIRPEVGMGAIRFSLGRYTAIEEIDAVVDRLTDVLAAGSRLNAKLAGFVEGTGRCSL